MSRFNDQFRGMGRAALEKLAAEYLDNLTATQKRCTELIEENHALKAKLAERPDLSSPWETNDGDP